MTHAIAAPALRVSLLLTGDEMNADIRDGRPESLDLFHALDETQREQLALDAWSIGLRALQNAHTSARESRLEDVGKTLLTEMDHQLRAHVERQQTTIGSVLSRFFDPGDGQVVQRLTAFLDDQGVLAHVLERYLAPQNSVLAEALARQVGEGSPLFKKLSITESDGLLNQIEAQLRDFMDARYSELTRTLDPLAEDSAVARFLRSLREELSDANEGRQAQLTTALAALDANDESSLLSRLVRETEDARRTVLAAMNPETPDSPIAMLKTSLTALLSEHAEAQIEFAKRQEQRQSDFEKEVREALARIETRRAHDRVAPRGGIAFEDAVMTQIQIATCGAPCVLEVTGSTPGLGRCKKGDAVLRFTDESAAAGAALVFEAKRDASYTVQKALDELDAARKNRDAAAGVFVMARSHASNVFPRFGRYGNNVVVTWDDEDPTSDDLLRAAIMLGVCLVSRSRVARDEGDIDALRDIESRIETELSRLDKMEKHSDGIAKHVEGIAEEIRKARKALDLLLRKAKSTLTALKIEVDDEAVESASPTAFPNETNPDARLAITAEVDAA